VRILWNDTEKYFQAEFAQASWAGDKDAAQAAGFRTSGPPAWTWFTTKPSVLTALRDKHRPAELTLTERALAEYKKRNEEDVKKTALRKEFTKARKALGPPASTTPLVIPPGKFWISAEDLPPWVQLSKYVKLPFETDTQCFMCSAPLIFCDYDDLCLWCSKGGR
jgi:hypothetical protein